ncbi:MAG: prohibitin family protein [Snowella sp.]|nr:prohibitin family protein [Snowella sp.]
MSLIISALTALIAFFVFLNASKIAGEKQQKLLQILSFFISLLAFVTLIYKSVSRFLVVIPTGEVGIVERFGQVSTNTLPPGMYWVNPLGEVMTFSTRLQDLKETVDSTSKEGLNFKLDVSLQYRLDPTKAAEVYQKLGNNEKEIIQSRFRSLIREITASYDLNAIYGEKRPIIADSLHRAMTEQLQPLGFIVEETLLRNIILPDSIQAVIQQKVATQQETEKLALEIGKARQEAERKKVEAQGIANSQKILSESLTDKIIKLKAIEATQKLSESPNSKVIIIGGGQDRLPLILSEDK